MKLEEVKLYTHIISELGNELENLSGTLTSTSGTISHTKKLNPYDLLTKLDVTVEDRVTARLRALDPNTPIVGEERGGDRTNSRYWLIDPIDGTIHFVRGNPFYCFMIALIVDDMPIVSMIYNFSTKELFHAIKGFGAYLNSARVQVSARSVQEAIVQTEVRLDSTANLQLQQLLFTKFRLLSLFCPGYEFGMIASGKAEGRICIDPFGKDYDFAPGALLIQEAGGIAKNLKGDDYRTTDSDIIVASSEEVYNELLTCVLESRSNR